MVLEVCILVDGAYSSLLLFYRSLTAFVYFCGLVNKAQVEGRSTFL
jgi:hypothetical protein